MDRGTLSTWIKVHFLISVSLTKGLWASSGSDNSQCSCYTFYGGPKSWSYGRQQCRTQGGDLVSMETVKEWELINTQIQNRTAGNFDEWWIGLEKRDGRWVWLSNHTLTYNKWQPHEPSNRTNEKCVVMAKNYPANTYGLFSDVPCLLLRGWICEYKKNDCSNSQVKLCINSVTPTVMTVSKTVTTTKTITNDFVITDSSTNTPYNNKPTQHGSITYQQNTTPIQVRKEGDTITSDHQKLANTDCLPYPLLVTAIFVCVLGGLTVLATVAFFLVPLVLKKSRDSIV